MRRHPHRTRALTAAIVAMGLGVLLHALHALLGLGGPGISSFVTNGVYTGVELLAVAVCAARVMACAEDRWAWALIAAGLAVWSAGDLVWTVWLNNVTDPPFPSLADVLYLAMYPLLYAGMMLLLRSRNDRHDAAQWLDGGLVALTLAAVGAGLIMPTILSLHHGRLVQDAVNLAYPLGDLTLLAFVVVAFATSGWRPGRTWALLGASLGLDAIADLIFVYQSARGTYVAGGILDTMWPAAMALCAVAAWQPARRRTVRRWSGAQTMIAPVLAVGAAVALLVDAAFHHVTPVAVALAAAALLLGTLRALLTHLELASTLRRSEDEAVTDGLTGLGNRRVLMRDLHAHADDLRTPRTVVFFDLNGFKNYNDAFGHAAGDALLARLGQSLRDAVAGHGRAYRLGGDEFCVLLDGRFASDDGVVGRAAAALRERGAGYDVGAALGLATMPDDAATPSEVLHAADERMYAAKARTVGRSPQRTRDVLLRILDERKPDLYGHVSRVGNLVRAIGESFALDRVELEELVCAAELHDVGKLGILDEILDKPGPLTRFEWDIMRRHAAIGERILGADPAMQPVARLVGASHERWDGRGYPDGTAGASIPLGARIIAVCDAYEEITADRLYQPARTVGEALAELRRGAGTQFDPAVVAAVCGLIDSGTDTAPATAPCAVAGAALPAVTAPLAT